MNMANESTVIGNTCIKQQPIKYIVAGLGNPGIKYENTRHNCGFIALDYIAKDMGIEIRTPRFKGLCGEGRLLEEKILLLKPQTFMNESGVSILEAMSFYKLEPKNVIIILDDVSLPLGKMRIRKKGSHGGQNGMRNIINVCGSDKFTRVKIGIDDKPDKRWDLADWVLSRFSDSERKIIDDTIGLVKKVVELIIGGNVDSAMNCYN